MLIIKKILILINNSFVTLFKESDLVTSVFNLFCSIHVEIYNFNNI